MEKQRKPLSTKNPPIPTDAYSVIEGWMANQIMPGMVPIIRKTDSLIHDLIPNLCYAIKWGNAYYGTKEYGWLIEVAAYHVSVNIVFLSGADFNPQPPSGTGKQTRYVKVRTMDELENQEIIGYIKQAGQIRGWK